MSTLCEVVSSPVLTNNDAIKESKDNGSQSESDRIVRNESAQNSKCDTSSAQSMQEDLRDQFMETVDEQTASNETLQDKYNKDPKKKKTRTRRNKWRRRKPYNRLANIDDKTRAHLFRVKMQQQCEKPLAPYNTTQFLMDDHNVREPDFEEIHKLLHFNHTNEPRRRCHSDSVNEMNEATSSDEFYSSPDDEQDFMQKQFFETYENIHAERLNSMSKSELVQEYLMLEERMEELERKLKHSSSETSPIKNDSEQRSKENIDEAKTSEFLQEEVHRLKEENKLLLSNNAKLMCIINNNRRSSDIPMDGSSLVDATNSECEKDASQRG